MLNRIILSIALLSLAPACDVDDSDLPERAELAQDDDDAAAPDESNRHPLRAVDEDGEPVAPEPGPLDLTAPPRPNADSSCIATMANIVATLNTYGGWFDFEMTTHRTDQPFVSFARGTLWSTGSQYWTIQGGAEHLFSTRTSGNQPFAITAADSISIWLSYDGQLFVHDNTWGNNAQWDLSCSYNAITRVIPGYGVITLTLRAWHPPIW